MIILKDTQLNGNFDTSTLPIIANLMTPSDVLSRTDFEEPFVIRPSEFPTFDSLLEYRAAIRNLRLVPVKDPEVHAIYKAADHSALHAELLEQMSDCSIGIAENRFKYWLPDDVDQYLVWVRDGVEDSRVHEFISVAAGVLDVPLPGDLILFERPVGITSKLVRGTFPALRHIHFWAKKK